MTYDPNSDQEQQNFQKESMPPEEYSPEPNQDFPAEAPAFDSQAHEPLELPQDETAYPDNDIPEEPEPTYRGKFSAKPSFEEEAEIREPDGAVDEPQDTQWRAPGRFSANTYENSEAPAQEQEEFFEAQTPMDSGGGFDAPPQEPQPPLPEENEPQTPAHPRVRAIKKGRPKRKKGEGLLGIPNLIVTGVWVALTLLISLTLGRLVWVCAAEVLAFGREDKAVTITVYETDTLDDITKKLARAELIHYPGLFKLYAKFAVDEGEIHPGMWDLNTKYDYHALVKMMSPSSSRSTVKVMIPEGYSCRQIFALLEENKVCTVQDISSYAATGELDDYWFLDGVIRGDKYCLEGFLFPDTYEFYQNDKPKNVLTKMLNNFNKRFDESLQGKIQTLNNHLADLMRRDGKGEDYINSHLFTVRDVVNVASMIEKETSSAQEGYTIASVIYNRLFCWQGNPPYLNIDATIVYALDGKTDLTAEDLRVDSPYNTYTRTGLTPGPISNPGLSSLEAALEPSDTNYYYYVLDPAAGSHIFATTQAEHEANRARVGG